MKLLFDQNISYKLVKELEVPFPGSNHARLLGLHTASDGEVWDFAKENGFTIVTQDSDFLERILIFEFPPKVVWLRLGNTSTKQIKQVLLLHKHDIELFEQDASLGCLQIF